MAKDDWPDERCIICLGTPSDGPASARTDAHVIPESVGGRLSAPFLCQRCNSGMGTIEGALPRDVIVLGLVDQLEGVLPDSLVTSIRRHADYFADTDEYGRIDARFDKRGELTPLESETLRTDRNTLRWMESELRRQGADAASVQAKVEEFARAAQGERIEVTPKFAVTKGVPLSEINFQRSWNEPVVPPSVPLGIAYLYLALCIDGGIYGESLEPARRALQEAMAGDDATASAWPIEWLQRRRPPEPKHGLAVQDGTHGIVVTIWLFRELVWKVSFAGVALRGVEPFYVINLVSGEQTFE